MLQKLKGPFVVLSAFALVAALGSTAALAAPGKKTKFGARVRARRAGARPDCGRTTRRVRRPRACRFRRRTWPGGPGLDGGFGQEVPVPGGHRGGPGGPGGGPSVRILAPAAKYLDISVATLTADLKSGKTLAEEATAKGKTSAGLIDAIVASHKTVLDAANAAGWITDAQETALLTRLTTQVTKLVNEGPPAEKAGPLEAAATYIGISVSALQADLKAGKTLAQVAVAEGKTVDGLVSALTAQAKTNLDKAVADGKLTAAQEQKLLDDLTEHVTNFVNHTKPAFRRRRRCRSCSSARARPLALSERKGARKGRPFCSTANCRPVRCVAVGQWCFFVPLVVRLHVVMAPGREPRQRVHAACDGAVISTRVPLTEPEPRDRGLKLGRDRAGDARNRDRGRRVRGDRAVDEDLLGLRRRHGLAATAEDRHGVAAGRSATELAVREPARGAEACREVREQPAVGVIRVSGREAGEVPVRVDGIELRAVVVAEPELAGDGAEVGCRVDETLVLIETAPLRLGSRLSRCRCRWPSSSRRCRRSPCTCSCSRRSRSLP